MKLTGLKITCRVLQIVGLAMLFAMNMIERNAWPTFVPVIIGISGFASIVVFFNVENKKLIDKFEKYVNLVFGLGLVIYACFFC